MELKPFNETTRIEVKIIGDWVRSRCDYATKITTYSSEEEFNKHIHLYIIYLDFYDRVQNDPKYNEFDVSKFCDLKDAFEFYFKNEHDLSLEDSKLYNFVNDMTNTTIPYYSGMNSGYSRIDSHLDIVIKMNNGKFYIEYNEDDVKSAVKKLMKEMRIKQ